MQETTLNNLRFKFLSEALCILGQKKEAKKQKV